MGAGNAHQMRKKTQENVGKALGMLSWAKWMTVKEEGAKTPNGVRQGLESRERIH